MKKNWLHFGVIVDEVWKISEFYLKNWIFDSILNFALMWTIGVNAKMADLDISFPLMEQINHCKNKMSNISMLSRCYVYFHIFVLITEFLTAD